LPEAEGLEELTLRVLEGERDRVYGRDRQSSPLNSQEKGTAKAGGGQIDPREESSISHSNVA
jgi:hypothetical protein